MFRRNIKEYLTDDTIDLSLNDLQDIPVKDIAQFPKATSLDLSNNKLTTLSKSFASSLTHLVKLDLARNELRELPQNFGLLVNLKHLDLYKNKLETLPLSFSNLKSLRWLDLKENPLELHWQQIVGPCLNAQDCRNAAKNVVNIASMMSYELEVELQKAQARQKKQAELDEIEQKELAKKREKQKEKKKRRNAAKHAELNRAHTVENGIATVEPIELVEEEVIPPPKKTTFINSRSISSTVVGLVKGLFYSACLIILMLYILKFVNEPLHNALMSLLTYNNKKLFTSLVPGHVHTDLHKITSQFFNNARVLIFYVLSSMHNIIRTSYFFLTSDPKFEVYVRNIIHNFLSFHVTVCNSVSVVMNTIFYPFYS